MYESDAVDESCNIPDEQSCDVVICIWYDDTTPEHPVSVDADHESDGVESLIAVVFAGESPDGMEGPVLSADTEIGRAHV